MGNKAGLFYDPNGVLCKIVHTDNDDFGPHMEKERLHVVVDRADYDVRPPINHNGVVIHHDLNKLALPKLHKISSIAGAKLAAHIDAIDASLIEKHKQHDARAKKVQDFKDLLSADQLKGFKAKSSTEYKAFLLSLTEAQIAAAPFDVARALALLDAL